MKLLAVPWLVWTVVTIAANRCAASVLPRAIGLLAGLAAIPALFYTYTGILGKSIDVVNILIFQASNAGVKIIISGDGIPQDAHTKERDFLGVSCQDIYFENGYPILYTARGELDSLLFDKENAQWKTVYFNGLDQADGYLYDSGMRVDFAGTVYNDNIVFIGLNLSYHYFLTKDENVGAYMDRLMGDQLNSLPDRTIVPLKITYRSDEIRIESPRDNENHLL